MACKEWKNDWVAHVYGEMEPDDARTLTTHLEHCAECAATLAELSASHDILQETSPEVPAPPRVVVLQPRPVWSGPWVFAAGAACSLILFGLGFIAGPRWEQARHAVEQTATRAEVTDPARSTAATLPAANELELRNALSEVQARLARLEEQPKSSTQTASQIRDELDRLEQRVNQERVRDLEHVFDSLTAAEQRTGTWMEQTHDALTLLALRQDPRYSER